MIAYGAHCIKRDAIGLDKNASKCPWGRIKQILQRFSYHVRECTALGPGVKEAGRPRALTAAAVPLAEAHYVVDKLVQLVARHAHSNV